MAARKTNRNAQTLKHRNGFRISRKPLIPIAASDTGRDLNDNGSGARHKYGARILFAIARDPQTIFASWNIDWSSLFEKVLPSDRQVHLRLYGADGVEEKSVPIEPMAMMHYLTTPRLHTSYRVEMGYYQPADVWHSVATSQEIVMPRNVIAETVEVDLATIPFHVGFQQLLNLFRSDTAIPLAVAISGFEKRVLIREQSKRLTPADKKPLRNLEISLPQTAAAWRGFDEIDAEKLMRLTGRQRALEATSPARGFQGDRVSGAS